MKINKKREVIKKRNFKDRVDVLIIVILFIFSYATVKFLPSRFILKYFYFSFSTDSCDLQPFEKQLRYIKKIKLLVPMRITCLMESIVVQLYFLKHKMYVPIFIGIKKDDGLQAHAWYDNDGQRNFNQILVLT